MKGLIIFADGFEDSEGITTRDILVRGGLEVVTASINPNKEVLTSHNVRLITDTSINTLSAKDYDFLIIPGGLKGVNNIKSNNETLNLIKDFINLDKYIFAICAAPSILGALGYLKDKKYTCYPGFENESFGGHYQNVSVIIDGKLITAKSMAFSIDFALSILSTLTSQDTVEKVNKGIKGF